MDIISKKHYSSIDEYIADLPQEVKAKINELRKIVKESVPDGIEVISYNMPAIKFHGILLYYAVYKEHIGFYPASKNVMEVFKTELQDYFTSVGAIRLPLNSELPVALLKKIIAYRVRQNVEIANSKTKKNHKKDC
jgi:uncharacterized protein YdhG (YjbR/CyaY superfamily)